MKKVLADELDDVVALAWADDCSFDTIHSQLGLLEKDVIRIMRSYLKRRSFELWRTRVTGRKTKHRKKYFTDADNTTAIKWITANDTDDEEQDSSGRYL